MFNINYLINVDIKILLLLLDRYRLVSSKSKLAEKEYTTIEMISYLDVCMLYCHYELTFKHMISLLHSTQSSVNAGLVASQNRELNHVVLLPI